MCTGLDDIKRQAIHNQIFEAFDQLELTDRTSTESEELRNATLKLLGTDILR
ncbi:hypothetical protein CSB67_3497 [Enterobacter hormaechei]|nr:hypothetical protein CSB67_3497 [Enterobacter hormaechei]